MFSYFYTALIQFVLSVLTFFGILSCGRFTAKVLFSSSPSSLTESNLKLLVYTYALGFVVFYSFWLGMAYMGWLTLIHFYAVCVVQLVVIISQRSYHRQWVISICRGLRLLWEHGNDARLLISICGCSSLAVWIRCWSSFVDGDSLVYHLFLPKQFVMKGELFGVPYSEHAYWPLMAEVSFIPAEIMGSAYLSKVFSFFMFGFIAAVASLMARRFRGDLMTSLWVAAIVLTTPYLFYHAASTYSDLFFSFYLLAALLIVQEDVALPRFRFSAYFAAGLFMGASVSAKYLGLFGVLSLSILAVARLYINKVNRKIVAICALLMGFLITAFPFYARAYAMRGNPFFPFLQKLFGTDYGWVSATANAAAWSGSSAASMSGRGQGLLEFLVLPWNLTFHPTDFLGDKIGFIYITVFIGMFFALRRNIFAALFCLFYTILWFISGQATRYLTPVLPILAAIAAQGLDLGEKRHGLFLKMIRMTVMSILIFQTVWSFYLVPKDFVKAKDSLRLRGFSQRMSEAVNDPDAKVLMIGESRIYYFNFIPIREKPFRHFTKYPDRDPAELLSLLDREEITRLIIVTRPEDAVSDEATAVVMKLIQQGFYKRAFDMPWVDNHSVATLYRRTEASTGSSGQINESKPLS